MCLLSLVSSEEGAICMSVYRSEERVLESYKTENRINVTDIKV